MPELPEVEVIKLGLEKRIVGKTLKKVVVLNLKTFQGSPQVVEGKKIKGVWRRAKMLGIDLGGHGSLATGHLTLLFHLKMTGQLILDQKPNIKDQKESRLVGGHPTPDMRGQMPNSSTRVVFEFSDGSKLFFNDQRKFGWVKVIKGDGKSIMYQGELTKLGPEPLEPGFTWKILKSNLLRHKSQPIKVALMDQSVVSGIGNIYASESLFLAKVDPRRKVESLSDEEFKRLHQGIIKSLKTSINYGGSTRAHFVNIEGEKGYFLDYANVYGKTGQKCTGCFEKVVKITQAGRGTYYCPCCQQ